MYFHVSPKEELQNTVKQDLQSLRQVCPAFIVSIDNFA